MKAFIRELKEPVHAWLSHRDSISGPIDHQYQPFYKVGVLDVRYVTPTEFLFIKLREYCIGDFVLNINITDNNTVINLVDEDGDIFEHGEGPTFDTALRDVTKKVLDYLYV
jgi:hypothetical protein